jgi:hypothetical protein
MKTIKDFYTHLIIIYLASARQADVWSVEQLYLDGLVTTPTMRGSKVASSPPAPPTSVSSIFLMSSASVSSAEAPVNSRPSSPPTDWERDRENLAITLSYTYYYQW